VTIQRFNIDFVTRNFGTCDLRYYIEIIKSASTPELRDLRAQVVAHSRARQPQQAFSNTPDLTTHGALLKAIGHTVLRRSPVRYKLWLAFMPLRQWLAHTLSGLTLKSDDTFGAIYTQPERRKTVLHMPHSELGRLLLEFGLRNWKFLVTTVIAVMAAAVTWLKV
jgi:hypothetical protein